MMGSSKGNWGRYSLQAFGISVLGPLLFYLINPIIEHFKGNRDAVAYTKTYVGQWDSIRLVLPENLFDQTLQGEGTSYVQVIKYDKKQSQRIYASNKRYYIPQYKKNFELIWIKGVDEIVGLYNRHHDAAYYLSMSIVNNGRINHMERKKSLCQYFYIELSQVII